MKFSGKSIFWAGAAVAACLGAAAYSRLGDPPAAGARPEVSSVAAGLRDARSEVAGGGRVAVPLEEDFPARAAALQERLAGEILGPASSAAIRKLLAEWGRSDPQAALHYALSSLEDETVHIGFLEEAGVVLEVWAAREPEAARGFVQRYAGHPRAAAELAPAMMRVYGALDAGKAIQWVQDGFETDSGDLRPRLAAELVTVLAARGGRTLVEQWLAAPQVAANAYARGATEEFARILAQENPHAALAFSKKLPRGTMGRGLALQEATRAWAARDLNAAADWLARTGPMNDAAFASVAGNEANIPTEIFTPAEFDYAIAGYATALHRHSPSAALECAGEIRDRSVRERLVRELEAGK